MEMPLIAKRMVNEKLFRFFFMMVLLFMQPPGVVCQLSKDISLTADIVRELPDFVNRNFNGLDSGGVERTIALFHLDFEAFIPVFGFGRVIQIDVAGFCLVFSGYFGF